MGAKIISVIVLLSCFSLCLAQQDYCEPIWKYSKFGAYPGANGLKSTDLNLDGIPEIIVSTNNSMGWYIMNFNSTNNQYEIIWNSPALPEGQRIHNISLLNWNNDSIPEIFVSTSRSTNIYNGKTLEVIGNFEVSKPYISNILIADADNDGVDEIVVSTKERVHLVNIETLNESVSFGEERGVSKAVVAQVDNDPFLEVITVGGTVYQLVEHELTVEWSAFSGNIPAYNEIDLIQSDEDNEMEVIITHGGIIHILDPENRTVHTTSDITPRIHSLLIENDSIIITGTEDGRVIRYNSEIENRETILDVDRNTVYALLLTDSDGTGSENLIVSLDSDEGFLSVFNYETLILQWTHLSLPGPFNAIEYLKNENKVIINNLEADNELSSGVTLELDYSNGRLIKVFEGLLGYQDVYGFESAVFQPGEEPRLLVHGRYKAQIVNPEDYGILYEYEPDPSHHFNTSTIVDIDFDGDMEIIAGHKSGIVVLNHKLELLNSVYLPKGASGDIMVSNIDQDPYLEIIAVEDWVTIIDDNFNPIKEFAGDGYRDIDIGDWNGDGQAELFASGRYGELLIINLEDMSILESTYIDNDQIDGIITDDWDNDGKVELIVFIGGRFLLLNDSLESPIEFHFEEIPLYWASDIFEFQDFNDDNIKDLMYLSTNALSYLDGSCFADAFELSSSSNQVSESSHLNMFPNPCTGMLYISNPTFENLHYKVLNVQGQLVHEEITVGNLDLTYLESGIYFIRVFRGHENVSSNRIIKL